MDSIKRNINLEQQGHHIDTIPHNLVGIFKVRFHVHRGNELVWQYPPDLDLQGVEYQMICSGLHLVEKDTIYFSRWNGFGIGIFEKQAIDHDRGASMQAIGVLVDSSLNLWQHLGFLKQHIGKDDESVLQDYFIAHRLNSQHQLQEPIPIHPRYLRPYESVPLALSYYVDSAHSTTPEPTLTPLDSFSEMVSVLGPTIFVYWKAIMTQQRVLLMKSCPPMETLCHFVYNGYLMDQWGHSRQPIRPKFNIGINDITDLEKENSGYIACTCDTIFDIKKDLYDVLIKLPPPSLINDTTIVTSHKINAADLERYRLLTKLFPDLPSSPRLSCASYYRYKSMCWWDGLRLKETMIDRWTTSSPQERDWKKYQQQLGGGGSIHAMDETDPLLEQQEDAQEIDQALLEIPTNDLPLVSFNHRLLGFFHVLSSQLISTLQTILLSNQEEDESEVTITIQDMLRLGLEPWEDRGFVNQLGMLYFGKQINVSGCALICCCSSDPIQL